MKYQRSSVSGLVIAIVFTIFYGIAVLMILLTTGAFNQAQQQLPDVYLTPEIIAAMDGYSGGSSHFQESKPGVPIVVWIFIGVSYLLFMTIAFILFIKGKKCERIMKYGKKGRCTVFNIETYYRSNKVGSSRGHNMIVEYKGESGNINKLMVPLNLQSLSILQQGMVIECYIDKEDCYADLKNIKEIKNIEEF